MEERQQYAILFAVTLVCARKLIESMESDKPNMAKPYWVDKAIDEAVFKLEKDRQTVACWKATREIMWSSSLNTGPARSRY